MPEFCPRCDATLPIVDGAPAAFCANCGLPQLRVSEEWPAAENGSDAPQDGVISATSTGGPDWPVILRISAIAAAVGVLPCVLLPGAVATGNAGSLALFLLPVITLVTTAVYLKRRPLRLMTAGTGARMGAVLALFLTAGVTLFSAITGFVLRYRYHSHVVEQSISMLMQGFEAQVRAKAVGPQADGLLRTIRTPEWHAGMYLSLQLTVGLLLLCVGSVFGALAGAMLGARQRRNNATQ